MLERSRKATDEIIIIIISAICGLPAEIRPHDSSLWQRETRRYIGFLVPNPVETCNWELGRADQSGVVRMYRKRPEGDRGWWVGVAGGGGG